MSDQKRRKSGEEPACSKMIKLDRSVAGKLALGIGILLLWLIAIPSTLEEDALISYRYSLNLARGYGLVSSPAANPVEGFSNPTLTVVTGLIAALIGPSFENVLTIGFWIGLLAAGATVIFLYYWNLQTRQAAPWVGPLFLVVFEPYQWYSMNGLETPVYTLLVMILVYQCFHGNFMKAALAALALALTRPEGIGLSLLCLGLALVTEPRKRRQLATYAVFFIIPYLAFLGWRVSYFHDLETSDQLSFVDTLVPNTALAKLEFGRGEASNETVIERGISYLLLGIATTPILILLYLLTIVRLVRTPRAAKFEIAAIVFQVGFILIVGGDVLRHGPLRFIMPILPLAARSLGELFTIPRLRTSSSGVRVLVFSSIVLITIFTISSRNFFDLFPLRNGNIYRLVSDPAAFLRRQVGLLGRPQPWLDYAAGEYLASLLNTPEPKNLRILTAQQGAFALALNVEAPTMIVEDIHGLISRNYATDLPEKVFMREPPDLVAVYRWRYPYQKTNEIHFPSIKLLQATGFVPLIYIKIAARHWFALLEEHTEEAFWAFLVFVRQDRLMVFNRERIINLERQVMEYGEQQSVESFQIFVKELEADF